MPVALLRSASKQLHQGLKAVKQRVSVGRSSSFDGSSRGSSFSSVGSPGFPTPSSGTPSCRRSIQEGVPLDFSTLDESSSKEIGDANSPGPFFDTGGSSHSHRLQSFIHKISSFGSAVGDASESSHGSGNFGRHRRQKSESGLIGFPRRKSLGSETDSAHRGLDLHLNFFKHHRSDLSGNATEATTSDDEPRTFGRLMNRLTTGEDEPSQTEDETGRLSSMVRRSLHNLKRHHSENES